MITFLTLAANTGVFIMITVVVSQAVLGALDEAGLKACTLDIVHPNMTTAFTEVGIMVDSYDVHGGEKCFTCLISCSEFKLSYQGAQICSKH